MPFSPNDLAEFDAALAQLRSLVAGSVTGGDQSPLPDAVSAAAVAIQAYVAAQRHLRATVTALLEQCPEHREAILLVEEAGYAAISAVVESTWRLSTVKRQ